MVAGGACVVAWGHAWLLGGHVWLLRGCMVAPGGVHDCSQGVCVVAPGGHAWLLPGGGMHGIRQDTEIRSINELAVRILLECILIFNIFVGKRLPLIT